jgi:mannosyltransferase OCH1-like enzyme
MNANPGAMERETMTQSATVDEPARGIPRIIHQIFFGGESAAPPSYRRYAETWRKNHPAWDFQFWDASRCRSFLEQHYPPFLRMYDGYAHRIQRIDAIRYFILHRCGGVYVDMDIENLRPIDDLIAGRDLLLGALRIGYTNAVMGSVPGHALWPRVFETLLDRQHRFSWRAPLWSKLSMPLQVGYSTGPVMLTDCVSQGGHERDPATQICPSYVFEPLSPRADALPSDQGEVDLSGSYGIHHMSMHWLPFHHRIMSGLLGLISKASRNRAMGKVDHDPP